MWVLSPLCLMDLAAGSIAGRANPCQGTAPGWPQGPVQIQHTQPAPAAPLRLGLGWHFGSSPGGHLRTAWCLLISCTHTHMHHGEIGITHRKDLMGRWEIRQVQSSVTRCLHLTSHFMPPFFPCLSSPHLHYPLSVPVLVFSQINNPRSLFFPIGHSFATFVVKFGICDAIS